VQAASSEPSSASRRFKRKSLVATSRTRCERRLGWLNHRRRTSRLGGVPDDEPRHSREGAAGLGYPCEVAKLSAIRAEPRSPCRRGLNMSIAPTCRPRNCCRNRESDLERAGPWSASTARLAYFGERASTSRSGTPALRSLGLLARETSCPSRPSTLRTTRWRGKFRR
jgi:hypothetical protein